MPAPKHNLYEYDWSEAKAKKLGGAGEQTGAQRRGGIAGALSQLPGFGKPSGGTYDTYRKMSGDPTIALAKAIALGPVKAADHTWEHDDDTPEERMAFIRDQIEPRWRWLVTNALRAVEFGWQGFELVHELLEGGPWGLSGQYLGYRKFKPLLQDRPTEIMVNSDTDAYEGLKQGDVELPPQKTWLFTNEWSPGNLYGRSRHENCRSTWSNLNDLVKKEGQYVTKVAALIMLLQYPEGVSRDAHGTEVSNIDLARDLLAKVASGHSVAMPNTLVPWIDILRDRGITPADIAKIRPWLFDIIEAKHAHGKDMVEQQRHKESLLFAGWLVPPRAALEGQFGTKAEAGEHADAGIMVAEETHLDVIEYANLYLVDPLLAFNWGESARGTVYLSAVPMVDEQKQLFRQVILEAGKNPAALEAFSSFAVLQTMADALGLPVPEEGPALLQRMMGLEEGEIEPAGGRLSEMFDKLTGEGGNGR